MQSHSRRTDWIPKVDDAVRVVARRGSMTVWRCFCFCRGSALRFFAEPDWRDARISKPGAWGRSKRGPVNDRGPVIFSARSARSVHQRAYATCPRPSRMPARRTLWRTPDMPQVCDGAAPLASPSAKSLIIPTVSPPVQSAAQGEHPPARVVQHAGSAKPRTHARRHRFKRWRLLDIRRRLRLPCSHQ